MKAKYYNLICKVLARAFMYSSTVQEKHLISTIVRMFIAAFQEVDKKFNSDYFLKAIYESKSK